MNEAEQFASNIVKGCVESKSIYSGLLTRVLAKQGTRFKAQNMWVLRVDTPSIYVKLLTKSDKHKKMQMQFLKTSVAICCRSPDLGRLK